MARFVAPGLLLLNLSLLGCGVPLAAAELTATAEVGAAIGSVTEVSSRAAGANPLDPQATAGVSSNPAPLSTIGLLSTPQGATSPTVSPARTAGASPGAGTATVTRTPAVTPSPSAGATATTATPATASTVSALAASTAIADLAAGPTATPSTNPAAAALKLLNDYRASSGRGQLVVNPSLAASATAYAQLMARTNYFGHTGPDGSIAETRMAAAGYRGRFKGEALAAGQASADAAVRNWITSPSHASIILDPAAVEVGIGYAFGAGSSYGHYWVLVTGVP
ncbi:MAG TPA: CAP domain-containing protein [Dehalococcoidia bacterium]|nr:CAP domain-containing protein [Dehalococcoidia bacterium]